MRRKAIDSYTGPTTLAIDVSAYQGAIDWAKVARSDARLEGVSQGRPRLAIIRTSDGVQTRPSSNADPRAVENLRGAHAAGLRCAVYHFVRAHHIARAQVELILHVLEEAGVPVVFVALDIEGQPDDPSTRADEGAGAWWSPPWAPRVETREVLRDLDTMRAELERAGHRIVIYSGVAWHWQIAQRGIDVSRFAPLPLWTPYYGRMPRPSLPVTVQLEPAPWPAWTLWQYTPRGVIAGIRGNVDLNRFRGDEAAFERWCDAPSVPVAAPCRPAAPLRSKRFY